MASVGYMHIYVGKGDQADNKLLDATMNSDAID